MYFYEMGAVISELRRRAGMSQEELAYDICAPATISKIERGIQMPSKMIMDELLIRLKRDSAFFAAFLNREELSAVTSWEKLLFLAKGERNSDSIYEEQLFSYVRTIDRRDKNVDARIVLDELKETLKISVKEHEKTKREKYYTKLELHILNSIAVQYYSLGDIKKCLHYLTEIKRGLEKRASGAEGLNKFMTSVLNNMSAALLMHGDFFAARMMAEKGIAICVRDGFMPPLASLYRNLSRCLLINGMVKEAESALRNNSFFKGILEKRELIRPFEIMQQPYLIAI